VSTQILSAPELFAKALGKTCEGAFKCHWCFSPCTDRDLHDDPPPVPFVKSKSGARNPAGIYVCLGCWTFRRKRMTVRSIGGQMKDGQCPMKHSWLVREEARVVAGGEEAELYRFLLAPTTPFCLMLGTDSDSFVHLAHVNAGEAGDRTMFKFTLNNITHQYSPYELYETLHSGPSGREPGAQALARTLGPYEGLVERPAPPKPSAQPRLPKRQVSP
jgi:hypothetical protein